jgi:GNAT superfamily N-acetyltransferase
VSARLRVERLALGHRLESCNTGDPEIDHYLHRSARIELGQGLAAVHLAVDSRNAVVGFFTLSPLSLRADIRLRDLLGRQGIPYPQLGGFLLGRMGVDRARQGKGIGGELIELAAQIAAAQITHVGGAFLAVDPKSDALVSYYERFGFLRIDPTGVRRRMLRVLGR